MITTETRLRLLGTEVSAPKPDPVAALGAEWPKLSALARGERLKKMIQQGYSQRGLARRLECSPRLIRELKSLAELPEKVKQDLRAGKLGRKKAGHQREVFRAEERQRQLVASAEGRQELIETTAKAIAQWLTPLLAPCCMERFLSEIRSAPYNFRRAEFQREALGPAKAAQDEEPSGLIRQTQPEGPIPEYIPDRMNYLFTWFARWGQRIIPDADTRYDAIAQAARLLG